MCGKFSKCAVTSLRAGKSKSPSKENMARPRWRLVEWKSSSNPELLAAVAIITFARDTLMGRYVYSGKWSAHYPSHLNSHDAVATIQRNDSA